jgi:hypothetical protein
LPAREGHIDVIFALGHNLNMISGPEEGGEGRQEAQNE